MKVRITRLRDDVELPRYQSEGAVAFDLASCEDAILEPHQAKRLPTGLGIATPPGFALIISGRSSLFLKKQLVLRNGIGIVDQDFAGPDDEISLFIMNLGNDTAHIAKGERLCQGMFVPIERADWIEGPADRPSRGGWGSTGSI